MNQISQTGSSFNTGRWVQGEQISNTAPAVKGRGKWSVQNYGYLPGPLNLIHNNHKNDNNDDNNNNQKEISISIV